MIHQGHRQTDRQTDRRHYSALHGKKNKKHKEKTESESQCVNEVSFTLSVIMLTVSNSGKHKQLVNGVRLSVCLTMQRHALLVISIDYLLS